MEKEYILKWIRDMKENPSCAICPFPNIHRCKRHDSNDHFCLKFFPEQVPGRKEVYSCPCGEFDNEYVMQVAKELGA